MSGPIHYGYQPSFQVIRRNNMRILSLIFAATLLFACAGPGEDPAPHVTPVCGIELCGEACTHMAELGCEEGTPVELPDGGSMSCSEFCQYEHENGVYWNTECIVSITTCEQIESKCNTPPCYL